MRKALPIRPVRYFCHLVDRVKRPLPALSLSKCLPRIGVRSTNPDHHPDLEPPSQAPY